jgi:secondary thiamine-phosphate synthase enzyme
MLETQIATAPTVGIPTCHHERILVGARSSSEFVDITDLVVKAVRNSGVRFGIANVQTRHTTTGIIVNEHEPLLLDDMSGLLDRLVPGGAEYRHDDMTIRRVNLMPGEPANGHSHCRAMLLGTSETLNVVDERLDLGRWQRVFLVELDRDKEREVSVMVMGST